MHAKGQFDVIFKPFKSKVNSGDDIHVVRNAIDKTFRGDLDGTSRGEMLSVTTSKQGSAGYVALEKVTGTLDGKKGTFVLQHYGIMNRGQSRLILEVVPDSGTGELSKISGSLSITIINGEHTYDFDYTFE